MTLPFAARLDALSGWRTTLARGVDEVAAFLAEHDLGDAASAAQIAALQERLAGDKLVVAFVAEFSRGKSELINAIFFADTGRRVLPATPGRTTMCPVELAWDDAEPASLRLLPIETRLHGASLAQLRAQRDAWTVSPLPLDDPERLALAMQEVTRTRSVSHDEARELGLWDDAHAGEHARADRDGRVEVPAWRHAIVNYPHPLLQRGLVVLDTPGLNAVGAEAELTLNLLPSAHATVFVLGADTGVTKSDLGLWRDHLAAHAATRYAVLNKIDALHDPLVGSAQVEAQIAAQCADAARMLGIGAERVFPLSARQALAARIAADEQGLVESRLPALEAALGSILLRQRREVVEQVVVEGVQQLDAAVARRLSDRRRHLAEQTLELRGLRGKSGTKLRLLLQRVDAEVAEFEQCGIRLQALRSVHSRLLREALRGLSPQALREEIDEMEARIKASPLNLGAKKAFAELCARLARRIDAARTSSLEIRDMLGASYARLNAEFGFSLTLTPVPVLERFGDELGLIRSSYAKYLGLTQALRLSQGRFMEQFCHMLASKLRLVFENACSELEIWGKAGTAQIESQLRERRRSFKRRRESIERVQTAAGELEARLLELEAQDARLNGLVQRARGLFEALRERATARPTALGDDTASHPQSSDPKVSALRVARA